VAGGRLDEIAGRAGVHQAPGPDVGGGVRPAEEGPGRDGDVDEGGQRGLAAALVERGSGRWAVDPGRAALILLVCLRLRLIGAVGTAVGVVFGVVVGTVEGVVGVVSAVVGVVFAVVVVGTVVGVVGTVEGVVFVGAGVVVGLAAGFRPGFAGRRGEAVPGAALVDAVDQDGRADLGEGAGQAGVAEPDRLGVDRRLAGQGLGRVELPPGQARGA
jgi:hypothetical protein